LHEREGLELHAFAKRHPGFSLTELVVALAVAMILLAVGLPAFLRFYHSYQLTNAAHQVADYLRLARYEAIRLNKSVPLQIQPSAFPGMTSLWVDSNGNGVLDTGEMTTMLGTSGNLVGSGVPGIATLISGANLGSFSTTAAPLTGTSVTFDARGAVVPPTSVNMFYLASSIAPDAGYRAVLLLPVGSIQIWTGDATGNWQQLQ
jgi:prepilin-type N-terminal cleavage/methylation domain-containing protein